MPKMKTRKSIIKRIKVTATGKLMRRFSMNNHLKSAKSKNQIRRHRHLAQVSGTQATKLSRLMGR